VSGLTTTKNVCVEQAEPTTDLVDMAQLLRLRLLLLLLLAR
jgi:hypothetical protein